MLEEKNDNLQNADGELITGAGDTFENGYSPSNKAVDNNDVPEDIEDIKKIHQTEGQLPFAPEEVLNTGTNETKQEAPKERTAVDAIEESNAEEGEDDSASGKEELPELNYEALSMEELTAELEKLVVFEKVMLVKDHVEDIKKEFYAKYTHDLEEKKEEYSHNNDGDISGFDYNFPLKSKFDEIYYQYKDRKNSHFKKIQNDLKGNLENRLAIIEELKNLVDSDESMKEALKHVGELRDKWKNAGPIPRDKYNHVWNNFHFHMERFYDHLNLDRETRDMDFRHNLEQKQKIIVRVEELLEEKDIMKAFRELQSLHKMWKEEIGPVSREHREEIWNRFSDLTKQLHDKREAFNATIREREEENLKKKKDIIAQIDAIAQEPVKNHSGWQGQIQKIEALRNAFFSAGKVPIEVNEDTWAAFKAAVRNFNSVKNSFYKEIKKDQQENLNKKQALVEKAQSLKDSDDYAATTQVMKQIQEEWKKIGHVPRKYSDSLWKEFKAACNHYFDKLHAHRNEANKDELEAFEKKKEYLESLKDFELVGDHKTDLDAIKQHIDNWKAIGRVPQARRHIEGKFNKILDALFDKLSLSKKETEMVKFSNRLEHLAENEDSRKLENEQIFIMRKIDEVKSEILQLENNIQFISNAKADNPFIKEVNKNIERHKEDLKTWKEKLTQIRNFNQGNVE
ncbi:DUF349 domain-containing protein [Flavobacterium arcticum]|uniref:DUF349 domain-containing protein n=1 Tax=Flavobacterium arcticum TaxID=1784713 RepID=A0A345HEG1_9FLAO|nr:DUF349 domain-containing protein [Flavobacterium arcticum]AXG74971.1 DUF349 domain-containing protein [Flavobacterium arcticum]KAF2506523.1 DUF349 domain-containing protein [Flavobacterium arcticum]